MRRLLEHGLREAVVAACKNAGYTFVTIDQQGYRTGAMREAVTENELTIRDIKA
jgi:PP-loop superfamily ATP-utilizing enzyme